MEDSFNFNVVLHRVCSSTDLLTERQLETTRSTWYDKPSGHYIIKEILTSIKTKGFREETCLLPIDVAFRFCKTAAALARAWSRGAVFDLRQYCEHEHQKVGQNHLEKLIDISLKTKRAAITFFFLFFKLKQCNWLIMSTYHFKFKGRFRTALRRMWI